MIHVGRLLEMIATLSNFTMDFLSKFRIIFNLILISRTNAYNSQLVFVASFLDPALFEDKSEWAVDAGWHGSQ
jgi:hypothetical protein